MEVFWSESSRWVWMVILAVALFFPVRHLIWIMSVRRIERREGASDEALRLALRRRAGFTAALLCFVFAVLYVNAVFVPH